MELTPHAALSLGGVAQSFRPLPSCFSGGKQLNLTNQIVPASLGFWEIQLLFYYLMMINSL